MSTEDNPASPNKRRNFLRGVATVSIATSAGGFVGDALAQTTPGDRPPAASRAHQRRHTNLHVKPPPSLADPSHRNLRTAPSPR